MSSFIISFIIANWADILITLVGGGLFFYLGRNRLSDYYKRVTATDFMIAFFVIILDIIFIFILFGNYIDKSETYTFFLLIAIVHIIAISTLLRQREQISLKESNGKL